MKGEYRICYNRGNIFHFYSVQSERNGKSMKELQKKELRKLQMLELIKEHGFIATKDLARDLNISYPTVCRNLTELEKEKKIERFHGGVKIYVENNINSLTPHTRACADYYLYNERQSLNSNEKKAIGSAAAKLLQPNDIIFLSHGTTTCELAKALDPDMSLTIITDGLDITNAFSKHPNIHLYLTGGTMNYKSMQIEHNPYISCDISRVNISKICIGVGGISQNGLAFYDFNSFAFIQQILNPGSELIVLADSSKFDTLALANFITLSNISMLVTDSNISSEHLQMLESFKVPYILAE